MTFNDELCDEVTNFTDYSFTLSKDLIIKDVLQFLLETAHHQIMYKSHSVSTVPICWKSVRGPTPICLVQCEDILCHILAIPIEISQMLGHEANRKRYLHGSVTSSHGMTHKVTSVSSVLSENYYSWQPFCHLSNISTCWHPFWFPQHMKLHHCSYMSMSFLQHILY